MPDLDQSATKLLLSLGIAPRKRRVRAAQKRHEGHIPSGRNSRWLKALSVPNSYTEYYG